MIVLAVDPGNTGGLAFVDEHGGAEAHKMPATRRGMIDIIKSHQIDAGFIEKVWSSPQMGVASSFTFGCNYEGPIIAMMCHGIPVVEVLPQRWQKDLGLISPPSRKKRIKKGETPLTMDEIKSNKRIGAEEKAAHKIALKERAEMLFPRLIVTMSNCDALLIATWGLRQFTGAPTGPMTQTAKETHVL